MRLIQGCLKRQPLKAFEILFINGLDTFSVGSTQDLSLPGLTNSSSGHNHYGTFC
jgi:hypothetical protein